MLCSKLRFAHRFSMQVTTVPPRRVTWAEAPKVSRPGCSSTGSPRRCGRSPGPRPSCGTGRPSPGRTPRRLVGRRRPGEVGSRTSPAPLGRPPQTRTLSPCFFGGLAEIAQVKSNQLVPKAGYLTWEEAAASGLVNSTACRQLVSRNGADLRRARPVQYAPRMPPGRTR